MTMFKDIPLTTQIDSEEFLVVYSDWSDTYSELMTLGKLTNLIGFSDCTDFMDFRIYRVCKYNIAPVEYCESLTGCTVSYYIDGKRIAEYEYEDH